jgi:hypothetical protein
MKFKVTKKEMKASFNYILGVGYCDLQTLLKGTNPVAYSVSQNGWACDYYEVDNVLICTGYQPLKSKNVKVKYADISKYNELARDCNKEELKILLKEFIEKFEFEGVANNV